MSFNNPKCSLSDFLMQKKQQISYEINNLNNDIIMANTVQDIVDNIQTKYMLEVIQISDSEIDRDIRENTVRKYNPFYHRGSYFDKEYYDVPGFTVKFSHSIIGDIDLLSYHASTYLMWHPDNLNISKNVAVLEYSEALNDNVDNTMNQIMSSYNHDLKNLKDTIKNTNKDINEFNNSLPNYINELVEKKEKTNIVIL